MIKLSLLLLALLIASAHAEDRVIPPPAAAPSTEDLPRGAPYHAGDLANSGDPAFGGAEVPLRDYLSSRIDSLRTEVLGLLAEADKRYSQRFDAQQNAVDKALADLKLRLDSVNEFRQTLTDQATTFTRKDYADTRFSALEERVNAVISRLDQEKNIREGAGGTWQYIIAGIGVLAVIVGLYLNVTGRMAANAVKPK